MIPEDHQRLVNSLANALKQKGIKITHIDIGDTPQLFNEEYRRLPKPPTIKGKTPDLQGTDQQGLIHLGEAEIDVAGSYTEQTEGQLRVFGNRVMPNTNTPVPLHVIVHSGDREAMESIIRRIGLGGKIGSQIHIWA